VATRPLFEDSARSVEAGSAERLELGVPPVVEVPGQGVREPAEPVHAVEAEEPTIGRVGQEAVLQPIERRR
jgi:hypothetical protein